MHDYLEQPHFNCFWSHINWGYSIGQHKPRRPVVRENAVKEGWGRLQGDFSTEAEFELSWNRWINTDTPQQGSNSHSLVLLSSVGTSQAGSQYKCPEWLSNYLSNALWGLTGHTGRGNWKIGRQMGRFFLFNLRYERFLLWYECF